MSHYWHEPDLVPSVTYYIMRENHEHLSLPEIVTVIAAIPGVDSGNQNLVRYATSGEFIPRSLSSHSCLTYNMPRYRVPLT